MRPRLAAVNLPRLQDLLRISKSLRERSAQLREQCKRARARSHGILNRMKRNADLATTDGG
jgi:hypothetical protein